MSVPRGLLLAQHRLEARLLRREVEAVLGKE
jgi:hypothetical protein